MKLDHEDIQQIAERVVELLLSDSKRCMSVSSTVGSAFARGRPAPSLSGLVDAATLAQALGVDRRWVYAHAKQLGGIRLGGPQGRLRFDLARLGEKLDPASPYPAQRPTAERTQSRLRAPVARSCQPAHPPKKGLKSSHTRWPGSARTPPARHREV